MDQKSLIVVKSYLDYAETMLAANAAIEEASQSTAVQGALATWIAADRRELKRRVEFLQEKIAKAIAAEAKPATLRLVQAAPATSGGQPEDEEDALVSSFHRSAERQAWSSTQVTAPVNTVNQDLAFNQQTPPPPPPPVVQQAAPAPVYQPKATRPRPKVDHLPAAIAEKVLAVWEAEQKAAGF